MPRPCNAGGSSLARGFVPRQDRPRNLTAGINALVGVGSRISTCCRVHSDIPTHAARAPGPSPRPTRSKAGDARFRVPGSALPRPGKKLGRRRRPFFLYYSLNAGNREIQPPGKQPHPAKEGQKGATLYLHTGGFFFFKRAIKTRRNTSVVAQNRLK